MNDPRDPNCRAHSIDKQGLVDGIHLTIHTPQMPLLYDLISVRLIPEGEAGGRIVATTSVLDASGQPEKAEVALGWPYNGTINLDGYEFAEPKREMTPLDHVISRGFTPPNLGPYILFVGSRNNVQSPIIASMGLPYGHHVAFEIVYARAGATVPPPPSGVNVLERLGQIRHSTANLLMEIDALILALRKERGL